MYGTYKIWVLSLFVIFACMTFTMPKESCAGVMSVDDIGGFGNGALKRDIKPVVGLLRCKSYDVDVDGRDGH
ncbi:MAG: hypothetical protein GY777_04205 [Candidatus Brocadiaceae bacterium]|nr:hypothetical protein [Candidatus Brocadiaceae bacterium]